MHASKTCLWGEGVFLWWRAGERPTKGSARLVWLPTHTISEFLDSTHIDMILTHVRVILYTLLEKIYFLPLQPEPSLSSLG